MIRIARASRKFAFALAAIAGLAAARNGWAANVTWTGGGSTSSWFDSDNWNPGTVFGPTIADDIVIGSGFASGTTLQLESDNAVRSMIISTLVGFTIETPGSGLNDLKIATGSLSRLNISGTEADQQINANVVLGASGVFNINGSGELTIANVNDGLSTFGFTKSGSGRLIIEQCAYGGNTTVSSGVLELHGSLGTGTHTVSNGAALELATSSTTSRVLALNGTGISNTGALHITNAGVTWAGNVALQSDSTIGVDSSGLLEIEGIISDFASNFSITKVGAGRLVLFNTNTYSGGTTVSAGELILSHSGALGTTSATVSSGASLGVGSGLNFQNDVTITGSGFGSTGALRAVGTAAIWAGNVILSGAASLGADTGELIVTGQVSGAFAMNKFGGGTVTLTNANTYAGVTTINAGILKIRNNTALGSAGAVTADGATLALQQDATTGLPISVGRAASIRGVGVNSQGALRNMTGNNTYSGLITLLANSNIGVDADQLTISNRISGSFDINKVGPGTLVLTSTLNAYNNTNVSAGVLSITVPAALPASGLIGVGGDGAAVEVKNNITVARNLSLNGSGISTRGALRSTTGVNTWSGAITLATDSTIGVDANELLINGVISGSAGLKKAGLGKLTLSVANTYTGTTTILEGPLNLANSNAVPPAAATSVSSGAAVELPNGVSVNAPLNLSGAGIVNTGALRGTAGTSSWLGPINLGSADAAIGVDAGAGMTVAGVISDGASAFALTKIGAGSLTLGGANTYDGGTFINGGTLGISADNALGSSGGAVTTNNGGKLLISSSMSSGRTFNLNTGSLQANSGVTITYNNATVNGGFLRGPGTHAIAGASTLSGVTALNGAVLVQSSPTTLINFTNAGSLTSNASLSWDGGFNVSSGLVTVNAALNTTGFNNDGVINIKATGSLTNTVSPLVSGGGSRITIDAGGQLNAGPSFELNGALLVNNGTVTGTTNVNFLALAKGSGVYGAVNVTDGGKFSPGNSPGSVTTGSTTWNSGGSYLVEIADALGGAGNGWDVWNINGSLSVNAGSTTNGKFTIFLSTMEDLASGFDSGRDYDWTILSASDGISGFDPAKFAVNVSGFKNDLHRGHFSISSSGNDLHVHFASVPEPALCSILISAFLARFSGRRRR